MAITLSAAEAVGRGHGGSKETSSFVGFVQVVSTAQIQSGQGDQRPVSHDKGAPLSLAIVSPRGHSGLEQLSLSFDYDSCESHDSSFLTGGGSK